MNLGEWIKEWTTLAEYQSSEVPDVDARIANIIELCAVAVPAEWTRPSPEDDKWADGPYRRGDRGNPSQPERTVEDEILGSDASIAEGRTCMGGAVVGGINAIPLTAKPKIEADVLLRVQHKDHSQHLYLVEAKKMANTPWYATLELLRQMSLFRASGHAADYFHRCDSSVPKGLPVTGLVVAPAEYYAASGKRSKAVAPTRRLVSAVNSRTDHRVVLATWDDSTKTIAELAE